VPNTNETKSELLLMTLKQEKSENFAKSSLKEGALVNGTIKSIKDRVMFV
jgi:ribosomal protein S1